MNLTLVKEIQKLASNLERLQVGFVGHSSFVLHLVLSSHEAASTNLPNIVASNRNNRLARDSLKRLI
jgi:hypothetical protein